MLLGDGLKYEIHDSNEQINSSLEESVVCLYHWEINPIAMQLGACLTDP